MNLSDVQSTLALVIGNAEELSAFAPAIVEEDDTDLLEALDAAVSAKGAAIVIGHIKAGEADMSIGARVSAVTVSLPVFIIERNAVDHSPTGLALLEQVIKTVTASRSFQLLEFERDQDEKAGMVAVAVFTALIRFTP